MAFSNLFDSAVHRAELVISTKKSEYGDFKIAKLVFGFVVVEVVDRWIGTLNDGKYLGDFEIQRIFNHTQTCKNTGFVKVSMRAIIGNYTLYKPDEIVPHLPNNLDQNCSDLTEQISAYKDEAEQLKIQLNVLHSEKEKTVSTLKKCSEKVTSLEVALSEHKQEKASLVSVNEDLTNTVHELESELEALKEKLIEVSTQFDRATEEKSVLAEQVYKLEQQKSEKPSGVVIPRQDDLISAITLSEVEQNNGEKVNQEASSSNPISDVFGDFFGDINSISDLPDEIRLKEIDEDIAANRSLLTKITKLLAVKHGGSYTLSPKDMIWRRV